MTTDFPIYTHNPDVVLREEDEDGGLLFNPDTNQVIVLNQTGLFIWQSCNGKLNLSEIVLGLKEEFDQVPEAGVINEAREFLSYLTDEGFLRSVEVSAK